MKDIFNKFKIGVIMGIGFIFTVLLIGGTYAFVLSNVTNGSALTSQMWNTMINNQVPVGTILSWHKSMSGVPSLKDGWVECDGSVINDPESPMNGQTLPNLNGEARFLRGGSVSGVNQGASMVTFRYGHGDPGYNIVVNHDGQVNNVGTNTRYAPLVNGSSYQLGGFKTRPDNMSVVYIMRIK